MSKRQKHEKRDLFSELKQGIEEIKHYKKNKKMTLRTYKIEKNRLSK